MSDKDQIRIHISACEVSLFVGVYDFERPQRQPVMIEVEAMATLTRRFDDPTTADMTAVIDYEQLYLFLTETLPACGHVALLESVAERIIAFCFDDPRIMDVRVRLDKPNAFEGKTLAGIEMRRQRAEKGWALVTGAARRIGRAIAWQLATDGWNVVVHYHRSAGEAAKLAEEIIAMGRQAVLAEIDLARADHVAGLIPALAKQLGPIAALINNASLFETDAKDPDGTLHRAINADAPRILSESFYRQVPADGRGAIVNLLDGVPAEKNFDAYNASKKILAAETLRMAREFAPRVRVNGVAPGPVLPNLRQSEGHFSEQLGATLLKTPIAPEDIAHAVSYFLTAPAVTGDILHVNGGRLLVE